jgi:segregation and condensation protein A
MAKKSKDNPAATATVLAEAPENDERRDSYRVKLEIFEGPLDLLLFLIRKDEIEITDIPIAHITEQYLRYLELMQELDIAVAGEFLVMASTLIYIKSKMLLPPDPKIEGEEDLNEDPRAELVERLLEYQKFKSAANMFYSRYEIESAVYTRGALETDKTNPEVAATVFDLLRVFNEILKRAESKIEMEIARDEVTMAEKLAQINALLDEHEEINVRELFELSRSKRELILTFLSILELVKEWKIYIIQRELFSDIFARRRDDPPPTLGNESTEAEQDAAPPVIASVERGVADPLDAAVAAGPASEAPEANDKGTEKSV